MARRKDRADFAEEIIDAVLDEAEAEVAVAGPGDYDTSVFVSRGARARLVHRIMDIIEESSRAEGGAE